MPWYHPDILFQYTCAYNLFNKSCELPRGIQNRVVSAHKRRLISCPQQGAFLRSIFSSSQMHWRYIGIWHVLNAQPPASWRASNWSSVWMCFCVFFSSGALGIDFWHDPATDKKKLRRRFTILKHLRSYVRMPQPNNSSYIPWRVQRLMKYARQVSNNCLFPRKPLLSNNMFWHSASAHPRTCLEVANISSRWWRDTRILKPPDFAGTDGKYRRARE